jgi:ABC-2 type transport system ATP-binding protein
MAPELALADPAPAAEAHAPAPLAVSGLSHAFGKRTVLDAVDLTVRAGSFTVLLGLNGAGKTTLFALVTRLYHARAGTITVFGHDIQRTPGPALARMGVVFQQPTLDLDLTVEQNLRYHAALHGMPRRLAASRLLEELTRIGLEGRRRDKVRQLSGGQRRRVELARALLHRPSLLLLDEPTVGLDLASRHFLLEHVRTLCREQGIGVLWATHLIDEVGADADVVVLHRGRVVASGRPAALIAMTGARDLRDAFAALTGLASREEGGAEG